MKNWGLLLLFLSFFSKIFCSNSVITNIDTFHSESPFEIVSVLCCDKPDSLYVNCNEEEVLRVFNQFINILKNSQVIIDNGNNKIIDNISPTVIHILINLKMLENRSLSGSEGPFPDYIIRNEDIIIWEKWNNLGEVVSRK